MIELRTDVGHQENLYSMSRIQKLDVQRDILYKVMNRFNSGNFKF